MDISTLLVLLLMGALALVGVIASTWALMSDDYRAVPTRTTGPEYSRDIDHALAREVDHTFSH